MSTKEQKVRAKQVWFMPWADLKDEISLGSCTIWPFVDEQIEKRITDDAMKTHLKKYFESYVNLDGSAAKTISICSYDRRNMSKMRPDEHDELRLATDIVAFSIITRGIRNFIRNKKNPLAPASSDRFKLYGQNFVPGNEWLAVKSGDCVSGGWTIGQVKFPRPWCIGGPFQKLDDRLIAAFAPLFSDDFDSENKYRLARSLEWFRLAHTQSDEVSPESKVVMMATALETLLAVPKEAADKQVYIAEWLDENCTYSDSVRKQWTGQPSKEHSAIGYWSRSFYDLRNRIVHGAKPGSLTYSLTESQTLPHVMICAVVLWECIVRKLFEAGSFADEQKMVATMLDGTEENYEDARKHLLMTFLDIGDMHRCFGWLPPLPGRIAE